MFINAAIRRDICFSEDFRTLFPSQENSPLRRPDTSRDRWMLLPGQGEGFRPPDIVLSAGQNKTGSEPGDNLRQTES